MNFRRSWFVLRHQLVFGHFAENTVTKNQNSKGINRCNIGSFDSADVIRVFAADLPFSRGHKVHLF